METEAQLLHRLMDCFPKHVQLNSKMGITGQTSGMEGKIGTSRYNNTYISNFQLKRQKNKIMENNLPQSWKPEEGSTPMLET